MDPAFLGGLQQFLMGFLGIYVTVAPGLSTATLYNHFGLWTWAFAIASILLGASALVLYVTISPAWCSLLSFGATATQAFVVLQLVVGVNVAAVQPSIGATKKKQ